MTEPRNPDRTEHRMERTVEVPATPEEVWDAIATAEGMSAWMVPTRLDPRAGGEVTFDLGGHRSAGVVTDYTPNRRIAYEEPWPMTDEMRAWVKEVADHEVTDADMAAVGPIATEFLVESSSGGSCVIRVVTSAYGTGADWENEFFAEMVVGWGELLDNLAAQLGAAPAGRTS